MSKKIFFVGREGQQEVEKLRQQEYAKAPGFTVDLETLRWKTSDDESFIMVAQTEAEYTSTMRGEVLDDLHYLERKLECPWIFPVALEWPVLLLSRAATLSSHQSEGLNLILRYWFLRFAKKNGIKSVIGTFVAGSPREQTLREMGYHFFENKAGWQQSTYRSHRPVHIVLLDMHTHGNQALAYCEEKLNLSQYEFEGEFPPLRFVRSL